MEEATTSDTPQEGTAPAVSEGSVETANVSTEGQETSSEFAVNEVSDEAFKDVPKELRGFAEKYIKDQAPKYMDREFKRYLTKHTQERAVEQKQRDLELELTRQKHATLEQQHRQLQAEIQATLKNPELYEKYRQQIAPDEVPNKLETVEDLIRKLEYQDRKIREIEQSSELKASRMSAQQIQTHLSDQRYESAVNQLSKEDTRFGEFSEEIIAHMQTRKDLMGAYNGKNELEILKQATDSYWSKLSKRIDLEKQSLLESQKLKKTASTIQPQKKLAVKPGSEATVKDQVIAAVRERMGY